MNKALNYLKSFWNQLILYLKDGRYSIDNSLAERTLRPMTVERKNSLTFGSHDGAEKYRLFTTRLLRLVRCVAYQRLNILRNSSRQSCRKEPTNEA